MENIWPAVGRPAQKPMQNGAFTHPLSQKLSADWRWMDNVMPPAAACSRSKAAESSAPTKAASELDSSTSSVLKPAFFRWNFDLSGSYARGGRSGGKKGWLRGIGWSWPSEP